MAFYQTWPSTELSVVVFLSLTQRHLHSHLLSVCPPYGFPEFLCGMVWGFLSNAACLPVWVSPHMWHTVGKRVNSPLPPSLTPLVCSSFPYTFSFIPETALRRLVWPPCAYSLCVELFFYGELRLIAVQGPFPTQRLPCSVAPSFPN